MQKIKNLYYYIIVIDITLMNSIVFVFFIKFINFFPLREKNKIDLTIEINIMKIIFYIFFKYFIIIFL